MLKLLACLSLATAAITAAGQGTEPSFRAYPEDMRSDLAVLWSTVQRAHPDPYRYLPGAELARLVDSTYVRLAVPLGIEAYLRELMPVLRAIGDAGTRVDPPEAIATAYARSGLLLPISVAVINDKLYLDEELKGFRSLPPGCELLSINGVRASDLLQRLRDLVVPEGANTTRQDKAIERDFPVLYRRCTGSTDRFIVEYRDASGLAGSQVLFAMTGEQIGQYHRSQDHGLRPWRLAEFPDTRSAWLTLATMDRAVLSEARIVPEKFLNNVLDVLRKGRTGTLVMDLRGAGGVDLALAEQVFALVAQAPYRVVSSASIGVGAGTDMKNEPGSAPEFFASVGNAYLPEEAGRRMMRADDPRLAHLLPMVRAFSGKVYVVCDGATTEAGAALVMLAKRSGRARVVGEEIGSNATSFCGGQRLDITLPGTGCRLQFPLNRYVPEGAATGPADHGELPTYAVPRDPQDMAKGRDTVRDKLMMLIKELQ